MLAMDLSIMAHILVWLAQVLTHISRCPPFDRFSLCPPHLLFHPLCCGVWSVGGCIYQGVGCLSRSPPPRTRHQTPPTLRPRPEWVPAIYSLTSHTPIYPATFSLHSPHTHTRPILHPPKIHYTPLCQEEEGVSVYISIYHSTL